MNLQSKYFSWIKRGKCLCCESEIEFIQLDDAGILVNNQTKGRAAVPGLWTMSRACTNPNCEWSKIKDEVDAFNFVNSEKAWGFYGK